MKDFMLLLPALLVLLVFVTVPAIIGFGLAQKRVPIKVLVGIAIADGLALVVLNYTSWVDSQRGGSQMHRYAGDTRAILVVTSVWIAGLGAGAGTIFFRWRTRGLVTVLPLLACLLLPGIHWAQHDLLAEHSRLKDEILIENFRRHEREFRQLAAMYDEDQRPHYICPSTGAYPELPPERLDAYTALMATADVGYGIEREWRGAILFRYWAVSGSSNADRGYALLDHAPERLRDHLDPSSQSDSAFRFQHIDGSWYLYYYDRDSSPSICDLDP